MTHSSAPAPANFWDQQYAQPDFKYGTQPNAFVLEQATRLRPGSQLLLPGDGEGRNSVWLAEQGHHVTAVDGSALGIAKALTLAQRRGVTVHAVHADLGEWVPEPQAYDAVVLTYLHLPPALRTRVHGQLLASLRDGGLWILETFHPRQLGYASGGPKAAELLYTLEALRQDLQAFGATPMTELLAWEGEVELDEGSGHQGPAYVTRLIAQKGAALRP